METSGQTAADLMSTKHLLDALLDSWDRNNTILLNFLRLLPVTVLETRPMKDSPSVAELFMHMHYVRLVFVSEDLPELGVTLPEGEWRSELDPDRIAEMLKDSARTVRNAVQQKVEAHQDMKVHYDHPILMLQHVIWHEGYHQGQMKLALKLAGNTIKDDDAGAVTWDIWMDKMH